MPKKPVAIRLKSSDWEATYVGGKLIEQGAPLRANYVDNYTRELKQRHGFGVMVEYDLIDKDIELVRTQCVFPSNINQLFGKYGVNGVDK